ncbi:hypothetical protein [Blastococcus sp. TBT05-19]|uniref:hypothetical protein n=1 Tax=Blastococcus sp. TBT05-19 TaxID=2250581 RepID=UPI0011BF3C02|nr:hypothetical protein [Blastococcus sp. TBT05-19]
MTQPPPWTPSQGPFVEFTKPGLPEKKPFYKRPWFAVVAGVVVLGAIGNAAGSADEKPAEAAATSTSAAAPTTTTAPTTPAPQPVAPPVTPTPAPTSAAPVVDFVMPDLVGTDLQTAQNTVQTHNVWLSVSHDLLGSRNQVLDSNWIVCDQNVPPGQRVTGDVEGAIDFGVVKREEACP